MSDTHTKRKEKIGIIVGGGPAPGINDVISAAAIEAINQGKEVIGIIGGFKSLLDGKPKLLNITMDIATKIHGTGGSILRTSRDTPEHAKKAFDIMMTAFRNMGIKCLITIGGDGTLHMANWIEKEAKGELKVVHAPKTIDNDIPLPGGFSTFGYQTARHIGTTLVKNIIEDARTTGRWYFITVMGRHAGHLALGMCEASGATLSLIPEEFNKNKLSLKKVVDTLSGSIIKRLCMGKDHGVAILAEGIAEKFDIEELKQHQEIKRNEKGEIKLSEIQLGGVLKNLVEQNLQKMGINFTIVNKKIGYELRAADPIPFDMEYTRYLGYGAIRHLLRGGTGSMIVFYDGNIKPVPFNELIDQKTGQMKIRKVDLNSETYEAARQYMIRLEKIDFQGRRLERLSKVVNKTPDEFKNLFEHILDN